MKRVCAALCLLLAVLTVTSCGIERAERIDAVSKRVIGTPTPTGTSTVGVDIAPRTKSPAKASPKAEGGSSASAPRALSAPNALPLPDPVLPKVASTAAFTKLGGWIDVFDHHDDAKSIVPLVRGMFERGAKTLYLETARFSSKGSFEKPAAIAAALDEAKALGMKVVAWYPPNFEDVSKDVKRSVDAVRYVSPRGNRFDAFGADIEYTAGVPDHAKRNKRVIDYTKRLRQAVGAAYPMSAIVIPPSWLERTKTRWPNFPWAEIGKAYDVVMPMEYWTAIGADPGTAYSITKSDVQQTRSLTGRPVHIIGGLGAEADGKQVDAYVKAVKETGSIGGGLYDYTTTRADVWDELRKLN